MGSFVFGFIGVCGLLCRCMQWERCYLSIVFIFWIKLSVRGV